MKVFSTSKGAKVLKINYFYEDFNKYRNSIKLEISCSRKAYIFSHIEDPHKILESRINDFAVGFVIKICLEFSVVEHFCKAFPISDCWLARVTEVAGAARQEMIMCSPARFHSPLKLLISCFVNGEWLNASQKNRTWKVWYSSFVYKYFYTHLD